MKKLWHFSLIAGLGLLAACEVGPDYKRPSVEVPVMYKEAGMWMPAKPSDDFDRGAWWLIYGDGTLDALEQDVLVSNQNLKAAEAAYREASAIVDESRASLFPIGTLNGGVQQVGSGKPHTPSVTTYSASVGASWAPDIWGRIRRTIEANEANAQATAADLADATLSAQATLATSYFDLRIEDELKRLFDQTVLNDRRALEIVQNQFQQGTASKGDVVSAETQLQIVRTQAIDTGVRRAQLEHAIAVLIGKMPSNYTLLNTGTLNEIPAMPGDTPSTLLERRPDISSAERQMAAANAQIGVQVAAYYPNITLDGSIGVTSVMLGNLFSAPSTLWSFGPSLTETIFDAGAREAAVAAARATYDQSVANYRQTVLTAFQQVEDNLASLRILAQEAVVADQAVLSARQAEDQVFNQYLQGIVPYSSVLTAQTTTLNSEETALNVHESRLAASVGLIQALGGGWTTAQLPRD